VLLPDRAVVEGLERFRACAHVAKASEPDEAVRVVQVAKLNHPHPNCLLSLDELTVEQIDERVPHARVEPVLPQLDDRVRLRQRAMGCYGRKFVSRQLGVRRARGVGGFSAAAVRRLDRSGSAGPSSC
jgi:hypothetical protein